MHLHGFNMYVLHEGPGSWDGTIINRHNPQRRDVVQIRGNGHLVIQFDAGENPGTFTFPDSLSLMIITPFCGHGCIVLTCICS